MNDNKEEKTSIGQELCRQLTHEYTTLLEASPTAMFTLKRDERNWILFASECKFNGENLERILNSLGSPTYGGESVHRERDLKMIWARILTPKHSLLDVSLTDLDEFLARQVPQEDNPEVLSLIARKYLDLYPLKKETLQILWRTGVGSRPEDERLWEQLESLIPDAEERRQILEEGFQRSFRHSFRHRTRGFHTPEQIRQWQAILTRHALHHQSDISFLREKWMKDILTGDRPDRRWMGWWGLSLSGVESGDDEETLLGVLASRLEPLMQGQTGEKNPTGGQRAGKMSQTDLIRLEVMELEAMAQWRPDCPVRRRKALELWEKCREIPDGWGKYFKQDVWQMARFRLESEENLLAEVKQKMSAESMSSVVEVVRQWTPENPAIREQFLGVCEEVLDSFLPGNPEGKHLERKHVETILTACFRLDIPLPRLFSNLEKIFLKLPVMFWPTNLAARLKGISHPTGLMSCDTVPLLTAIRIANQYSYLNEENRPAIMQTGLELLRLTNELPEPPSATWTRNALEDIAGATPDKWESIRWEILVSLPGQDPAGKIGHRSSARTCLSVIPEWLTLDDEGCFGSATFLKKAGGLIQIIRFLRSENQGNAQTSFREHGIRQALQAWLEQENFHLPQMEEFFPVVFLGKLMSSHGNGVNHLSQSYRIISEMESSSPTCKHQQSIIKSLKYEVLIGITQRVLEEMKKYSDSENTSENTTVFRLLRTLLQCFPEQPGTPTNVLDSIVKKMLSPTLAQCRERKESSLTNMEPRFVVPSPDLWERRGAPGLQPQKGVGGEPSENRMPMSLNR